MKSFSPSSSFLNPIGGVLSLLIIFQSVVGSPSTTHCRQNQSPGPGNPNFEAGYLDGWHVISGNTFGNNSVSSETLYWGGPFNQVGQYFLWGYGQAGDSAVGQIRSSSFNASSYMSFLVSGGYDPENLYIALVRESDGDILLRQTGVNDEALMRVVWDTSQWVGQSVYMLAYDNSTAAWGHINLDDVRVGCDALVDGTLTFNVLGQTNQPAFADDQSECSLYAVDSLRPQFHYTPYQGWINDPAGLIQWNGHHHLFSQFNPEEPLWGPMHWSHAYSTDAVHWTGLPVALYPPYPNDPADTSGRWTGSAVRDDSNGSLRLIFTDFTDASFHPSALSEVISTASSSDGINFPLYSKNPIISSPPPGSTSGFRDPKVFQDPTDNTWKAVVGSGDSNSGKVHLYRSTDLLSWSYVGVLFQGDGSTGTMWECPNFFPLEGKWVLFYGGNSLGWYEVGTYNGSVFTSEKSGLLDGGPDSYAAQWYKDESGRNLLITWMGNWPTSKWPSRVNGWAGQQSITRELFIRSDGGLGQRPITELATLASGHPTQFHGKTINEKPTTLGSMKLARLQVTVDLNSTTASSFSIVTHSSSSESTVITYYIGSQKLVLDTTNSGYGQQVTWMSTIAPVNNQLSLDIFIDHSSLEIFAGDGTVVTGTVWPRYQESMDIKAYATAGDAQFESVTLTPLSSSWC